MSTATKAGWPVIAGWRIAGDEYAEPATAGGGYVEVVGDTLNVAYETQDAEQEMGLDAFLVTRVPVEVLRSILAAYDAAHALPLRPRPTLTAEERHQALDLTLARYLLAHPGTLPSQVSVLDLARWHAGEAAGAQ